MNAAVVTIAHGRHDHLRRQLDGLDRSTVKPTRHIVVAMGDPGIHCVADDRADVVDLDLGTDGHLPLARARNGGADAAQAEGTDLIVFLDVDCIPTPELIAHYVAAAQNHPDTILCGPVTYLPPPGPHGYDVDRLGELAVPHPARPNPAAGVVEAAQDRRLFWSLSFAVTPATWRRTGGFHPGYVGYGGEDTDFIEQAHTAGIGMHWVGGALAFHQHHPVSTPPVEHLREIVDNAHVFHRRWGWWPMTGWLDAFADLGLAAYDARLGWHVTQRGFGTANGHMPFAVPKPVRVATVPDTHPYIDAVRPDSVHHERFTEAGATGWEVSPLFDGTTFSAAADRLDLVHVHFGYEAVSIAQLERFVHDVRGAGLALVVTVHDLRNPHDREAAAHLDRLRILVESADAVITLTAGAAAEIEGRWSRAATVVAHPSLLDTVPPLTPTRLAEHRRVVGIHLKSLRANIVDPIALVSAAAAGAADAGAILRVDVHDHGIDAAVTAELTALAESGSLQLFGHERFTDDELMAYLCGLDVSVLPYQFGTHSGWLELCRDLGVAVVAPDCGYYTEQWTAVTTYANNERSGLDAQSLRHAVCSAVRRGAPPAADAGVRSAERDLVRAAHARVFANAIRSRQSVDVVS